MKTLKLPKLITLIALGVALAIATVSVPGMEAQQGSIPAAAPVPSQISAAKKLFIANAGDESDYFASKTGEVKGGIDRPYNQLYAAMKSWGKYQLVGAPADAD